MLAAVLLVPGVEFDVPIPRPFVLEESEAKVAPEWHLVTVSLARHSHQQRRRRR